MTTWLELAPPPSDGPKVILPAFRRKPGPVA
jgi:hypothetical protein